MLARLNMSRLAQATVMMTAMSSVAMPWAHAAPSLTGGPGTGAAIPPSAPVSAPTGETVAYAVPRNAPAPDVEIILPQPLTPSDAALYQRALALQRTGKCTAADKVMARVDDHMLIGPLLAARYTGNACPASPAALRAWYQTYGSEPEAYEVYDLLASISPASALPAAPQTAVLPDGPAMEISASREMARRDNSAWRAVFAGGLADWRHADYQAALSAFTRSETMPGVSGDDRAASAFWAARADLRLQKPDDYLDALGDAAKSADTLYGMLASRLLGQGFAPEGIASSLTEADITAVDAVPAGHLAFALLQVGARDEAAMALRALWPQIHSDPAFARSVMAVAARAGFVDITVAIGGTLPSPVDEIAGAHLPLPALHPAGGFTIDPSLVYALARTESGFNARAVSRCGARGLMQLMPSTAHAVEHIKGISGDLDDPAENLALGQGYVKYLGEQQGINNNLLAILASYNAGPGTASAWYSALQDDSDPLMFLESIPNNETRRFVRQVLADSWIYAEEIGLEPDSLDQLAEGNFPKLNQAFTTAAAN